MSDEPSSPASEEDITIVACSRVLFCALEGFVKIVRFRGGGEVLWGESGAVANASGKLRGRSNSSNMPSIALRKTVTES